MKRINLAILALAALFCVAAAEASQFKIGPPIRQGTPELVAVPEGGTTLAMLAIGFTAVVALRRKLAK